MKAARLLLLCTLAPCVSLAQEEDKRFNYIEVGLDNRMGAVQSTGLYILSGNLGENFHFGVDAAFRVYDHVTKEGKYHSYNYGQYSLILLSEQKITGNFIYRVSIQPGVEILEGRRINDSAGT